MTLPSEDLQQLGNTIMLFVLVNKVEKDIVDGATDISTKIQELAINPMQRGLQEVTFTRILAVKQFQELKIKEWHGDTCRMKC